MKGKDQMIQLGVDGTVIKCIVNMV